MPSQYRTSFCYFIAIFANWPLCVLIITVNPADVGPELPMEMNTIGADMRPRISN